MSRLYSLLLSPWFWLALLALGAAYVAPDVKRGCAQMQAQQREFFGVLAGEVPDGGGAP